MKNFKNIRQLKEDTYNNNTPYNFNPPGSDNAVDSPDHRIYDYGNENNLRMLNAYLEGISNRSYIDPSYVVNFIKNKLSMVGLQFDYNPNYTQLNYDKTIQSSSDFAKKSPDLSPPSQVKEYYDEFPLTFMGGRFGVLDDNYTVGHDDGIRHKLGYGLKLRLEYNSYRHGLVNVRAFIIKDA